MLQLRSPARLIKAVWRSVTLFLSALSCLNCSGPSFVASQKTSEEESPLELESSDDLSTWGRRPLKPQAVTHHLNEHFQPSLLYIVDLILWVSNELISLSHVAEDM